MSRLLQSWSIKQLYSLALAEGEGVGTAYEYYVKRLTLRRWLAGRPTPQSICMVGLPEKYGFSFDLFLLAHECRATIRVVDPRKERLQQAQNVLAELQQQGILSGLEPKFQAVDSLTDLPWEQTVFDLAVSSEVLQRLDHDLRPSYASDLRRIATAAIVFSPNQDNESHVGISGLGGVTLAEMKKLWPAAQAYGYIDLPPFPPGITRTGDQREHASTGVAEGIAMRGLELYARLEKAVPQAIRRKYAHIVYAFS